MYVEVIRPFTGDRPLSVGDVVDASDWTTIEKLIDQRYVREASVPDTAAVPVRGRRPARAKE